MNHARMSISSWINESGDSLSTVHVSSSQNFSSLEDTEYASVHPEIIPYQIDSSEEKFGNSWGSKPSLNISPEFLNPNPVEKPNGVSTLRSGISLFRCVVGVGVFFLPEVYVKSGFTTGLVLYFIMSVLAIYINKIIAISKHNVLRYEHSTYLHLCSKVLGSPWDYILWICIFTSNIGTCCIYLYTMTRLLTNIIPTEYINWYGILYTATGLVTILCWSPSMHYIAWSSLFGSFFVLLGMAVIPLYGTVSQHLPITSPLSYSQFQSSFGYSFSILTFLFIQPSTLFPISNEMERPKEFHTLCVVVYGILITINLIFATFVFMIYGETTQDIVIKNMCSCDCVGIVIKDRCNCNCDGFGLTIHICIVASVFFGYSFFLGPICKSIEKKISNTVENESYTFIYWKQKIVRTLLSILVCVIVVLMPEPTLTNLLNVTSGIALTVQGFVFGPLIYLKVRIEENNMLLYNVVLIGSHCLLLLGGLCVGCFTVYLTYYDFITYVG